MGPNLPYLVPNQETMQKRIFLPLLLWMLVMLNGCAVIGGIFKAGVWVGVIIVVAIIALVIFIISKASGSK
jgi:lipopolysaccharide export LptBFGC system permease protein LptF